MEIQEAGESRQVKVSLIITCYNRVHLLKNALISLKSQSVKLYELILSDDGSKEDIVSGIKDLVKDFLFPVKFIQQENKGFRLAKCRNNGAREATGDYLIYLDQDLIFSKNFLRTFISNIRKNYFSVGYPIRLTEKQTGKLTEVIKSCDYDSIISAEQHQTIVKQYNKDLFYRMLHKLHLRKIGPKLRGGVAGFFKNDFIEVNGYDENYIGWGNEDDDLGRRFHAAGVKGINPFKYDYPIHQWHKKFHEDGQRVNRDYYRRRKGEIDRNDYRCRYGYNNPLGNERVEVENLNCREIN